MGMGGGEHHAAFSCLACTQKADSSLLCTVYCTVRCLLAANYALDCPCFCSERGHTFDNVLCEKLGLKGWTPSASETRQQREHCSCWDTVRRLDSNIGCWSLVQDRLLWVPSCLDQKITTVRKSKFDLPDSKTGVCAYRYQWATTDQICEENRPQSTVCA